MKYLFSVLCEKVSVHDKIVILIKYTKNGLF